MADKMIRSAVRGPDGLAKAQRGTLKGDTTVASVGDKRPLFTSSQGLHAGTAVETARLNSEEYTHAKTTIALTDPRRIKVYIREFYASAGESNNTDGYKPIYEATERKFIHNFDYQTNRYYQLKIENIDDLGATISTNSTETRFLQSTPEVQTIKTEETIDTSVVGNKRPLFHESFGLYPDQPAETERLYSDGYNFARATIALADARPIRAYIREFYAPVGESNNTDGYKLIYETDESKHIHTFDYPINLYYQIKVEVVGTLAAFLSSHSVEVRSLVNTIVEREENNGNKHAEVVLPQKTKTPKKPLYFETSPIEARRITLGHDNYFYVEDENHVLHKYEDIKTDSEPMETGITWNNTAHAYIEDMVAFKDSIVIFTNAGGQARIYQMDSINDTPTLVYESNTENSTYWNGRSAFGIKSYDNGLGQYVLAGCYGRDPGQRDLLLSSDGGRSFKVIKKTSTGDGGNSHWHDVNFDPYHGMIWASEGDGVTKSAVYYSDDWGETWTELTPAEQPTAIIPFPTRVVFGRDGKLPGLDYYQKPNVASEYSNTQIKTLKEFKVSNTTAVQYYGNGEVHEGNEGYMSFSVFPEKHPKMAIGTGDGGHSWHFLYMAEHDTNKVIHTFFGIDDDYVYAYGYNGKVYYAERVEWV